MVGEDGKEICKHSEAGNLLGYMVKKREYIIVSVPEGNSRRPLTPGKPILQLMGSFSALVL